MNKGIRINVPIYHLNLTSATIIAQNINPYPIHNPTKFATLLLNLHF